MHWSMFAAHNMLDGGSVQLTKPLEGIIRAGHPWIYRDALTSVASHQSQNQDQNQDQDQNQRWCIPGALVTVRDRRGRFLARGFADKGAIGLRVLTTRDERISAAFWRGRFRQAAALRDQRLPKDTNAYRLVHGEGDRVPGCVVDIYGTAAVMRLDGAGATALRDIWADALQDLLNSRGVTTLLCRTGRRETTRTEVQWGQAPPEEITVQECGMHLVANLFRGQKTGLFLDHRTSRRHLRTWAQGKRVLNLYGYTGGFSVAAGLGGAAHVTTVDIAPQAIALAEKTWAANKLDADLHTAVTDDVFAFLSTALSTTSSSKATSNFDIIVADPPSFAPNEASRDAAVESYENLHRDSLRLLRPDGLYLAASCSSHIDRATFASTVQQGAKMAKKVVQTLDRWGAPFDHPHLTCFPEGDYLKVSLHRILA